MRYHIRTWADGCPATIAETNDIQLALLCLIEWLSTEHKEKINDLKPGHTYCVAFDLLDFTYDHSITPDEMGSLNLLYLESEDDDKEPVRYHVKDYETQFPDDWKKEEKQL